eukprot:661959_1
MASSHSECTDCPTKSEERCTGECHTDHSECKTHSECTDCPTKSNDETMHLKRPIKESNSLDDLQEKLSTELAPIFDTLNSIKTKEEIANFFNTKDSETIQKLLKFILIDSPNESTRLLKKLIDLVENTMNAKPDALSTSIHYGIALEYLVVGPLLIFSPKLVLRVFKFKDEPDEDDSSFKYQWLRIMGVFVSVLGIHHFMEARNVDFIGSKKIIKYSTYVRLVSSILFAWFVRNGWAEKPLLLQSLIDFVSSVLIFRESSDKSKL